MYSFSKVCRTSTWGLIPTGRDSCWKWNGSMIFQTIAWFCFQTNRPFVDVFWSKQTDANHRLGIYVFCDNINFLAFLGYLFPFLPSMTRIMYVVHPGCMWRSTRLGDNSLLVDSRWWFSGFMRSFCWSPATGNESTDDLERSLVDAGVLKWSGDGTHFLRHFSQWMFYLGNWWKQSKRIKYTTMDWLGIALKAVIQRWTAPRASRPGAIQSQGRKGRSSWAFKTPNACCSTKNLLDTADTARWCFIWDPGSIFFGVWSQVLEGPLNTGDNWRFINSFLDKRWREQDAPQQIV